jgi:nitroimidazol reductase NimA-like FMN-containing flavoprotein (pyridoxamine 5'-phosphate oxidase superfamily)
MNQSMTGVSREASLSADHRITTTRKPATVRVDVREMPHDEAIELVKLHHVGHFGVSFHDLVRVKLCNYVYSEGWIYLRTELDQDLVLAKHHPWAAFEVHEAESIYDWRSVEVSGAVEFLSSDTESGDWFRFDVAVRLLRDAVPQILTADDPMPNRTQVLRIHVDTIMGRESSSGIPDMLPAP